jgi:hypothetical protein
MAWKRFSVLFLCASSCRSAPGIEAEPAQHPFDKKVAKQALERAAEIASHCGQGPGPRGPGRVQVVYEPSGAAVAAHLEKGSPFAGTAVGRCVELTFMKATVPAFRGPPIVLVDKSFDVK